MDTAEGTVVPPELVDADLEAFAAAHQTGPTAPPEALEAAMKEVDRLRALEAQMKAGLAAAGLSENVEFQIDQRGLTVKLIGSQTFFKPDRPELTARGRPGPADHFPDPRLRGPGDHGRRPRGERHHRFPLHVGAVLGPFRQRPALHGGPRRDRAGNASAPSPSARPGQVNDDSTPELMERNRRVDIVIISDQPDVVRALIPEVIKLSQK